jgi:leucine dehydrogenase
MTEVKDIPEFSHERVVTITGKRSGLAMAVAIHSSVLGTAIGGCRVWNYGRWVDAVGDAMRLSAAMTQKNAAAGLNNGGGKCVICVPEGQVLDGDRRRAALLDLGDLIESLDGQYRTGQDVGTSGDDMRVLYERTKNVIGLPVDLGGPGSTTEPTARGVYVCLQATIEKLTGTDGLAGRRIVISGLGQIGTRVAEMLSVDGAELFVSDINNDKKAVAERMGATWVAPELAHQVKADIFVPAGIGGVITATFADELNARAIVGPANNQLADRSISARLVARNIVYAPDFIVNSGGAIFLALSSDEATPTSDVSRRVDAIGQTLRSVFEASARLDVTTLEAAEALASDRINAKLSEVR